MSRLLTARVVADQLGVSAETVLRWRRRGELAAIRLPSGAIRFRESEIEALLEEWATPGRGSVAHPAETPPSGRLVVSPTPEDEE
jgi:excisionase family DNA binding protein